MAGAGSVLALADHAATTPVREGAIMSQDNVRIIQAVYEAGARGDLPAVLAHVAPDFVGYESEALPYAGVYRGPDGFAQLLGRIFDLFHVELRADAFVDEGNRVVALVKGQFVPREGGAPIPVEIAECWTLRDHKIVQVRPYYWNPTPIEQHVTQTGRDHYAALVARYFEYAHTNKLEEVVAMFTDDAFATFVIAPQPFSGKEAIRGFYAQLFVDYPHIEPEIFSVIIEGNRAVTEQRMTIVQPDGTRIVMPFNTNHFTFEGDRIKTLRVMGSPA
jgi:ketosteroid isomerase-like protein